MYSQMNWAKKPTIAIEPTIDDLPQGVTLARNANNLFTIGRRPTSTTEEPSTFMSTSESNRC